MTPMSHELDAHLSFARLRSLIVAQGDCFSSRSEDVKVNLEAEDA
jgi:hypothetical protein